MKRTLLSAALICLPVSAALAQSSGSFDTLDLSIVGQAQDGTQAMIECLDGNQTECKKAGIDLSMVQNLGWSQNPAPEATGSNSSVTPRLGWEANAVEEPVEMGWQENPQPEPKSFVSVDFEFYFEYNSDQPMQASLGDIRTLAQAISDSRFADKRFAIYGHTDAAGSDSYNLQLSQRRAESIRNALMLISGLPAERFITAGRGEADLKDPANPAAPANRRVQIVLF